MPQLTVLMPVYNAERFLEEAIESVLNQSFKDFEFVIIDDCSTDESENIIKAYNDQRIRYYKNITNLGISASLNKGIEMANCPYIARMDADDICYPERLEKQMLFIKQNPDGALYSCDVKVISEDGAFIRQDNFKPEYFYYNLNFICWIYHPSVIFLKEAVKKIGLYSVAYAEDFELFWQLTRKHKHYHQPEVLLDYRVTSQSLHGVTKNKEYNKAHQDQLIRNIQYYTGIEFTISENCKACLQHKFEPLLNLGVNKIIKCIKALAYISVCIEKKENPNLNIIAVRQAAYYKKQYILQYFMRHLPLRKSVLLLVRLKEYRLLLNAINKKVFK